MLIKTVQTLVFEYPEDYQAEIEWNKKRDGDWVHQSTDTICSVYTLTNNYLIPTKAKHSFVDNDYFADGEMYFKNDWLEDEPQTDKDFKVTYTCSFTDCDNFKNFGFGEKCIECKRKQSKAKYKTEPQTLNDKLWAIQEAYDRGELSDASAVQAYYETIKDEPQTERNEE